MTAEEAFILGSLQKIAPQFTFIAMILIKIPTEKKQRAIKRVVSQSECMDLFCLNRVSKPKRPLMRIPIFPLNMRAT
jgi:hypothetical protein